MSRSVYRGRGRNTMRRGRINHPGQNKYKTKKPSAKKRGQYINPERYVKAATQTETKAYVSQNTFSNFDLHKTLQKNLSKKNIVSPSKIQDLALPEVLAGKDVVGLANTGTGKTIAFLLPILNSQINGQSGGALILAPTRELAMQVQQEARELGHGHKISDVLLIGGTPINRQIRALEQKQPSIIVGTPGRIKDLIERGHLDLANISTVVLDEVDRMLDMGFVADITFILSEVPKQRHSMFFSATINPTVANLIQRFANNPRTLKASNGSTSDNVEQSVLHVEDISKKIDHLHDILIEDTVEKAIVFCETKRFSDRLSKNLVDRGFKAGAIHGNKSQGQRQRILRQFKEGRLDILIATDVAARGIDVEDVTHVINYDEPQTYDDYTHRIGRTGRGGRLGNSITFVNKS